ncbi:MAG: excinuclease ABC subunit A [Rickettsiales bacterium]|nr:excinuclease ABC subunit A [Rickettsiales bacterium]|tara:strand:- start:25670 stop:28489 length:2820 start_codon:yes stop_codon:yes gene_type:complete
MANFLEIRGAREHNLKNISVTLPKDKLVVITGLSGSGKSSLAFDTIYAEGQRRYVESLSAYARQFLQMMQKPQVDSIEGLSPAISIEQKTTSKNPRSTVGTVTEIYDYLRVLFARVGVPYSPVTGKPIESQTISQMVDRIMTLPEKSKIMIMAPIARGRKGEYKEEIQALRKQGFQRLKIDGKVYPIDDVPELEKNIKHDISVVVDRLVVKPDLEARLAPTLETCVKLSDGLVIVENLTEGTEFLLSEKFSCPESGFSLAEIEPRLFSFNNPTGACQACDGLGEKMAFAKELIVPDGDKTIYEGAVAPWWGPFGDYYTQALQAVIAYLGSDPDTPFKKLPAAVQKVIFHGSGNKPIPIQYDDDGRSYRVNKPFEGVLNNLERRWKETDSDRVRENLAKYQVREPCESCGGYRLKPEALSVKVAGFNIGQVCELSISDCYDWFETAFKKLKPQQQEIAKPILREIQDRLFFLKSVGLSYLTLSRKSGTLSGGESQRIRLASQIGSGLTGVLYVLDEPSIGLHQRDNDRLLQTLVRLRDIGNTVLVVEHDEEAIMAADYVVDMGPGAGARGGEIIAQGTPQEILQNPKSITGQFLSGKQKIAVPKKRRSYKNKLKIEGVTLNNLKNVTAEFPLETLTLITGVSGGGKSSLVISTLFPALQAHLNKTIQHAPTYKKLSGLEHIDKVIDIDQSPIGRTPRSNPVTYTGAFGPIRDWFAALPESKARGYAPGRFSFNVKGGRCEACQGDGVLKIEMHFLADVFIECDQCKGKRYNRETLEVKFKNHSIADVLNLTVDEAYDLFESVPAIRNKLNMLQKVGLGYVKVGQSAPTLSGGEAQRIKLAKELARASTGKTVYILDEPTTGLHFEDIRKLLEVLQALVDQGNTVIVIEHNLDVIKTADWIIDIGPEGGVGGGKIVATGTPEQIVKEAKSFTGKYLKPYLK